MAEDPESVEDKDIQSLFDKLEPYSTQFFN